MLEPKWHKSSHPPPKQKCPTENSCQRFLTLNGKRERRASSLDVHQHQHQHHHQQQQQQQQQQQPQDNVIALCHLGETSRDVLFWLKIGVLKESRFHGMMKIATVLALLPILAKGQGNTTTTTTETTTTFPVCPEHGEPKWFQPATSTSSDFNVPALIPSAGAMDPDGKMWVYGGKDDLDTEYAWPFFNHLYYLDTKARAWHLVRPHTDNAPGRDGASMVIVDGNPWIFG